MAPEQARGGEVGPPADVWGLGVVLFEAAAGRRAFEDDEPEYPLLAARAPKLRSARRAPGALADLVDACLEPDPGRRPQLGAVLAALGAIAGDGERSVAS